MSGWMPIETAPSEADWWLVWSSQYGRPVVVMHRMNNGTFWDGDWDWDVKATHWFPLDYFDPSGAQIEGAYIPS